MSRTAADKLIRAPCTPHTAELSGNDWTVTWLAARVLTRSQAEAAMDIAEWLGTFPLVPTRRTTMCWDCIGARTVGLWPIRA